MGRGEARQMEGRFGETRQFTVSNNCNGFFVSFSDFIWQHVIVGIVQCRKLLVNRVVKM